MDSLHLQEQAQEKSAALGPHAAVAGYTAQPQIPLPSLTGPIVLRNADGGMFDLNGFTFAAMTELAKCGEDVTPLSAPPAAACYHGHTRP